MPASDGARVPRRRDGVGVDLLISGLVVIFAGVVLGPALLGRGTLADLDLLTGALPFRAIDGSDVSSTILCRGDVVDAYLPGIVALKQALYAGNVPTWNPYEVGGAPFAALPDLAWLNPLSLPLFLLPLTMAPAYVKLAEFVVGIAGMLAFLRRLGTSRAAALLAGMIFVSTGFMTMWTMWPQTRVAAWIPALFWALERLIQERRARDVSIVALVVASMLLGGFPAVTLYSLTLAGAYVLVRTLPLTRSQPREAAKAFGGAAAGLLLGVGVAAVQILPFASNLEALGLEGRDYAASHLPLGLFLTTGVPNSVGLCVNGEGYGPTNPIEAVGYMGVAALVLIVVSLVSRVPRGGADRSPRVFLALALVVVVGAVWVGGPFLDVLQELPFYSANPVGRGQAVFGFVGAVLAGLGFDILLRRARIQHLGSETARPWRQRLLHMLLPTVVLLGVGLFLVWVVTTAFADARSAGYESHLTAAVKTPLLLLFLSVAAVLLARFGPRPARFLALALIALIAVAQNTWFVQTMLPLSDSENFYPSSPTHEFLQQNLDGDRYGAGDGTMYPATSTAYGLRTPVGHEFTNPRWRDLLTTVDPGVFLSRTFSTFSLGLSPQLAAANPLLDQMSVRYWVASPENVVGAVKAAPPADELLVLREGRRGGCEVGSGRLRGVALELRHIDESLLTDRPVVHVAVHTEQGIRRGARLLRAPLQPGQLRVAVPGEDLGAGGRYRVDVWTTGVGGATSLAAEHGRPSCAAIRPQDDGLRLVASEAGAVTYERLSALPRIRWASRSAVVTNRQQRLARLAVGVPQDTVLLDAANGSPAGGGTARVEVVTDDPEHISVVVDAESDGYLVLADALVRKGWRATIDGESTALVHGNHAFAAVPVPEGTHRVDLTYSAPGLRPGAIVSTVSLTLVGGLFLYSLVRRRVRPTADPAEKPSR